MEKSPSMSRHGNYPSAHDSNDGIKCGPTSVGGSQRVNFPAS